MNKSRSVADKRVSQLPNWLWSNSNVLPSSYRRIWEAVREERPHIGPGRSELLVDTKKVFPLLLTSQLPTEVLGYIWGLANQKYAGKLTEQELYVVLALVAVAQTSYPFTNLEVLHLLPGPPEPRLNLALIYPNAPQISPHQDASARNDGFAGKHEIQGRSAHKASSAASATTIPGLVLNHSHVGETRIDSKIPAAKTNVDVPAESQGASPARSDGRTSHCSSSADSNDDFSDFQSAPPAVPQTTPGVPQTTPGVPMWDTKQGSAIGSRLANHNLGVKKTSDKQRKGSSAISAGSKLHGSARVLPSAAEQMTVTLALGAGKELLQSAERLGEIFPKCAVKNQAKTVILKDTVIRNSEPPKQIKESVGSGVIDKAEAPSRQLSAKSVAMSSSRGTESSPLDLMNLQQVEDKYSALRVLVEEPNTVDSIPHGEAIAPPGAFPQSDDFGDFVSAQQPESSVTSSVGASTTFGFGDASDLFGDFDRFRSAPTAKAEVSPNLDTVGEALGNLEIEPNPNGHPLEEKYDGVVEAEKVIPKEDTISVNSIDLGNGTVGVMTRSNSVPSLDLKSFLSPSADDEQQAENMHQLIYWEWKQYMESCVNLLQTAANVFGSITSDVVLQEVLASAQGYNFLCNLAEVAAVCRRVNFSHKEMDINIMGFDDLLMDIDRIWAEMEPFYANIPIVTELPVWPLHQGESSACCALCLTVVTSGRIVYNDNNYHVTCANLWLNCVNHNLPTLRYPSASFVSHSMPITATGNN